MNVVKDPKFIEIETRSIFQKAADWIEGWVTPKWLQEFMRFLQDVILIPTLKGLGNEALNDLRILVVEAAKKDWTGKQKFEYVYDKFRKQWSLEDVPDRLLNLSIEIIVNELKEKGYIS